MKYLPYYNFVYVCVCVWNDCVPSLSPALIVVLPPDS